MLHTKLSQLLPGTGTIHANTLPHSNWTNLSQMQAKIPPPPTLPLRSYVALLRETYASELTTTHTTSRSPPPPHSHAFSAPYLQNPILAGPEKKRHTFQIRARSRADSAPIRLVMHHFLRKGHRYPRTPSALHHHLRESQNNSVCACWGAPRKSHVGAFARAQLASGRIS